MDEKESVERTSVEKLQATAEGMAQYYHDDILRNLRHNPPLLRMTRFFLIRKIIDTLNKQPAPVGDAIGGHEVISWILGQCMRLRKAHPKKKKEEHRFEC